MIPNENDSLIKDANSINANSIAHPFFDNYNKTISGQANTLHELPKPRQKLNQDELKQIKNNLDRTTKVDKSKIMNFEEVAIKKSLFFRLYISGTIEIGNFKDDEPLNVKYEFVEGNDWEKEDGYHKGQSQYSCKGDGNYNYYCFNQHFGISYRSLNPYGWPQLVLTCCSIDYSGNEVVKGYGCIHVPASTGRHERIVHIFSTTSNQGFWGKFCGINSSETNDVINTPKVISTGEGREISRAKCEGWLKVVFQVSFRDMDKFGYINL